jgi:exodeoxyribonuclease VII large subunit
VTASAATVEIGRRSVTVKQLVVRLQVGLQESFPGRFWLEGEITGFKVARNGHAFFALKEEGAQIEAVAWRDHLARLPFTPEDGMQVLALVRRVDFYAPSGRLRLHVEKLEPNGIGALARALEERKARLRAEGLFDEARKRPIPLLPSAIGIATAPRSAALRDMLKILEQRFAERRILLRPCRVQGEGASADIAAALDDLNRDGSVDVIIVGRGGGSAEDLWCFNEEVVVRAIARSRIPVVSAVGHEIDWTLADLVADLRVPTPTAAAQRCMPERAGLEEKLSDRDRRLREALARRVDHARVRLRACAPALSDPARPVRERGLRLAGLAARATHAIGQVAAPRRARLERSVARLRGATPRTEAMAHDIDRLARQMRASVALYLSSAKHALAARAGQIDALSPLAVLDRGFSVARRADGSIVRDGGSLLAGENLDLRFAHGGAKARVLEGHAGTAGARASSVPRSG